MAIRVLIADDQEMVRAGFAMILEATDDMEVVAQVSEGREAVTRALELRPDVCLFDIRMPEVDGLEATRLVAGPEVDDPLAVVVVTTFDLDEYVYGALRAGASGFLLKNAGPDLLLAAIRAAHDGESLISPAVTTRLLSRLNLDTGPGDGEPRGGALSPREEEVLAAVARGLTNGEIAAELYVSLSTVKAHVANLMTKLGVRNRVELVIWAFRTGRVGRG